MTQWLIESPQPFAHAYPDDDSIEVAACGHTLIGECDNCGQWCMPRLAREDDDRCPQCAAKVVQ